MNKYEQMSNAEIMIELKQMQLDHEAVKTQIQKEYQLLEKIENNFDLAQATLDNRLKGGK